MKESHTKAFEALRQLGAQFFGLSFAYGILVLKSPELQKYASKTEVLKQFSAEKLEAAFNELDSIITAEPDVLNVIDPKTNSSLLMAASGIGYPPLVVYFINRGADVNLQTKYGVTALFKVTYNTSEDCIKILLAAGADHTIAAYDGKLTPEMMCSSDYKAELKKLFEDANAGKKPDYNKCGLLPPEERGKGTNIKPPKWQSFVSQSREVSEAIARL